MNNSLEGKTLKQMGRELTEFLREYEAGEGDTIYVANATEAVLRRWPELLADRDNVEQYVIDYLYPTQEARP